MRAKVSAQIAGWAWLPALLWRHPIAAGRLVEKGSRGIESKTNVYLAGIRAKPARRSSGSRPAARQASSNTSWAIGIIAADG